MNGWSPKSIDGIASDSILTPVDAIAPFKLELNVRRWGMGEEDDGKIFKSMCKMLEFRGVRSKKL